MFSRAGKAFLISLVLTGLLPAAAHAAPSDDVLTPTSAWLVGPASLLPPDGSGRGFCVMANQYGGGAMLRFSGAGDTLQAMAVDFRRPLFQAGRTYALEITMDGGFDALLNADAFDESTLLVNLENQQAIYGMIRSERTMGLSVEGQAMDVALLGAADGLKRMAACSSGGGREAAQPVAYPPAGGPGGDAPQAAAAISPDYRQAVAGAGDALPPSPAAPPRPQGSAAPAPMQGMRTITNAATGAAMAQQGGGQAPAAAPSAGASPQAPAPGSDGLIDRMLKKAADALHGPQPSGGGIVTPAPQAGQALALPPLQLPKPQPPKIVRGESAPDAYEQQTPPQAASAPPAGDAGPADAADAGTAGGLRRSIAVNDSNMPPDGGSVHSWLAVPGRDLRDVLAVWAYTRRVQLVWNTENDYTVRQSVATNGSFESAVQALLGQYAADPDRPVGRLYKDGAAGRQILLIEDAKSTVDNPSSR